MSTLQLSNMPEDLLRRLERLAERDRRSPAEAAVDLLARAVASEEDAERLRVEALLDEIRRTRFSPAPGTPDSVEMLREDRER